MKKKIQLSVESFLQGVQEECLQHTHIKNPTNQQTLRMFSADFECIHLI